MHPFPPPQKKMLRCRACFQSFGGVKYNPRKCWILRMCEKKNSNNVWRRGLARRDEILPDLYWSNILQRNYPETRVEPPVLDAHRPIIWANQRWPLYCLLFSFGHKADCAVSQSVDGYIFSSTRVSMIKANTQHHSGIEKLQKPTPKAREYTVLMRHEADWTNDWVIFK